MSATQCGNNPPLMSWATYNGTNNNRMDTDSGSNLYNTTPGYDAAGDLQSDGANTYLYDAEGTRVAKGTITNWSAGCDTTQNGFSMTASYILGPGNEQLAELSWSGGVPTPVHTNVWAGGQLTATYSYDDPINYPAGILYFPLTDWLGTRRMLADQYGNLAQTCDSLPFGDGESCPATPTEHLFTGKERDAESGNDYFEARYYSSAMGRFMSPDWAAKASPVPYATFDDPQSLNLYSYVRNNPLTRVDADGHCWPWCTALLGAALGAGAETIHEAIQGKGFSGGKITAAAVGGAVVGVIGPAGAAVGMGAAGTTGMAVLGAVIGGATERTVKSALVPNGKGTTDNPYAPKDVATDAATGLAGRAISKVTGVIAQPVIKAVVENGAGVAIDVANRNHDAKSESGGQSSSPQPPTVPVPHPNPTPQH